jgi:hypothetical protein
MASKIVYSCDKCEKVIDINNGAHTFEEVDGVSVILDYTARGFCNDHSTIGSFGSDTVRLYCKECFQVIDNIIRDFVRE